MPRSEGIFFGASADEARGKEGELRTGGACSGTTTLFCVYACPAWNFRRITFLRPAPADRNILRRGRMVVHTADAVRILRRGYRFRKKRQSRSVFVPGRLHAVFCRNPSAGGTETCGRMFSPGGGGRQGVFSKKRQFAQADAGQVRPRFVQGRLSFLCRRSGRRTSCNGKAVAFCLDGRGALLCRAAHESLQRSIRGSATGHFAAMYFSMACEEQVCPRQKAEAQRMSTEACASSSCRNLVSRFRGLLPCFLYSSFLSLCSMT